MITIDTPERDTKYVYYLTQADELRLRRFRLPQTLLDDIFHIRRLPNTVSFALQWDADSECHILV